MWKEDYLNIKGNMLYGTIEDNGYSGMIYKFVINNMKVCEIYNIKGAGVFQGCVYNRDGDMYEEFIYDPSLDIVKLKCLVLAKELSWDIKRL